MFIAFPIDGQEFGAENLSGLFKDGLNQVGVDLLVSGKCCQALESLPFIQQEEHVSYRGVVDHGVVNSAAVFRARA